MDSSHATAETQRINLSTTKALIAAFALALSFALTSCESGRQTQSLIDSYNLNPKETISVALPHYPKNFDWTTSSDNASSIIEGNVMAGLTEYHIDGSEVRLFPALAEKWDVADGGLKYTFKLRDKITWSDGEPLKARHFADAVRRALETPGIAAADSLFAIRGAKTFHDGKDKNFGDVGVRVPDDKTIVFELNAPTSSFPGFFAQHNLFPIRKDIIDKNKNWADPETQIVLGPYKVMTAKKDKLIILTRNENYGKGSANQKGAMVKPGVKNIVLRYGLSPEEELKRYTNAQLQAVVIYSGTDLSAFKGRDDLYFSPTLDMTYLTFDVRQKPFSNPIFRRAVGMSVDREDLAHSIGDTVRALGSMVPPGLTGYESNRGVRFDPDAAKELLRHSGYASLQKYEPFYMKVADNPLAKAAAENLKAQFKRTLGLDAKIIGLNDDAGKQPALLVMHWLAGVPDPDNFLGLFTSGAINNVTGWKNKNFDDFVKQAAANPSIDTKEKLYAKAQHILTETEMPVVPLFTSSQYCLLHGNVRHFPLNALGSLPFKGVTLE